MSSNFVAGASDKRDRVANLTALEKAQLHAFVLFRASLNGGNGTAQMVEQFFQLHPSVGRGPLLPGGDSISGRQKVRPLSAFSAPPVANRMRGQAPAAPPTSVPLDQAHSAVPQQSVQRGPIPPFVRVASTASPTLLTASRTARRRPLDPVPTKPHRKSVRALFAPPRATLPAWHARTAGTQAGRASDAHTRATGGASRCQAVSDHS